MSATTPYDDDIYLGFWMNRAYNSVQGSTLTLDRQRGTVLIAFLVLFVGATGKNFWKIVRYGMHIYFSSDQNSDAIYHQRQAILRNSQLPEDAASYLIHACFSWRNHGKKINKRLIPIALVAALIGASFFISGVLSSQITIDGANEVLIAGRNCGNMSTQNPTDPDEMSQSESESYFAAAQKSSEYLSYAFNCYRSRRKSSSHVNGCSTYTQPTLPYTTNNNAACPFHPNICRMANDNIFLDTGYLDSYKYLGLNKGPRFSIRLSRHCAPLETDNYTKVHIDDAEPSVRWLRYYYGKSEDGQRPYSYSLRMNTSLPPKEDTDLLVGEDYRITTPWKFLPIRELNETNGFLNLLWLESSNVKNFSPVDDPWFTAKSSRDTPLWAKETGIMSGEHYYVTNETARVLGCSTNFELCNPALPEKSRCYDIMTGTMATSAPKFLEKWPNIEERDIMITYSQYLTAMLFGTAWSPHVYYWTKGLPSLLTRFTLSGVQQIANIPSKRWQEEMEYVFQSNLAAIQARLVEFATGSIPRTREASETLCGSILVCKRMCYSQKIRSSSYYSFSVLGIAIILSIGISIMLVGMFVESVAELVFKIPHFARSRRLNYAQLEWHANSTWQLQRSAHEGIGSGNWSRATNLLPVTQTGELLATLDVSNSKHPYLTTKQCPSCSKPADRDRLVGVKKSIAVVLEDEVVLDDSR